MKSPNTYTVEVILEVEVDADMPFEEVDNNLDITITHPGFLGFEVSEVHKNPYLNEE